MTIAASLVGVSGSLANAAGPPVLLYDGWTGDLSIHTDGQPINALIVSSDSGMLLPQFAVFPQGTIDDAIMPGQLTIFAGASPLGDADFGPILPAALEARVVEADLSALGRYPDQSTWDGIEVDLGNGQTFGDGNGGISPEPAALALFVTSPLLLRRRKAKST